MDGIVIFNWNSVISIVSSFGIGVFSITIYNKLKWQHKGSISRKNESIIEAIVSEYSRRLKDFEKAITELHMKMDTVELRMLQQPALQTPTIFTSGDRDSNTQRPISQHQSHLPEQSPTSSVSKPTTTITQQLPTTVTDKNNPPSMQNGTIDYILKLLIERPRTSREIQYTIGRTREHTSRLMKGLYESNLVSRESNSKPFKYTITNAGRIKMNAYQQTNHSDLQTAVDPYSSKYSSDAQSQTAAF